MTKEAFDLSDEDFDDIMSNLGEDTSKDSDNDEPQRDETAQDDLLKGIFDDDDDTDDVTDDDTDNTGSFDSDDSDDSDSDDSDTSESDTGPEEMSIVHNGKVITMPVDEVVKLAQKGFDYESKTAAIAPHRRLISLVESDKEIQDFINQKVVGSKIPEIEDRDKFDSETEWLKANMTKALAAQNPVVGSKGKKQSDPFTTTQQPQQPQQPQQNTPGQEPPLVKMLRDRDPEHFEKVKTHLPVALQSLTVAQYQRVASNLDSVFKFYDNVKAKVLKSPSGQKGSTGSFNLRSGQGGKPSRGAKKQVNAWELSNKEFDKLRQKALGF